MMNEVKRIYRENRIQTITFVVSLLAATVSVVVTFILWQQSINLRVLAVETTATAQQMTLQAISDKLDLLNSRGSINTQRIQDTNEKVDLIYQFYKK